MIAIACSRTDDDSRRRGDDVTMTDVGDETQTTDEGVTFPGFSPSHWLPLPGPSPSLASPVCSACSCSTCSHLLLLLQCGLSDSAELRTTNNKFKILKRERKVFVLKWKTEGPHTR